MLRGVCVGSVDVDEADRMDCEIEEVEGRIVDRVMAIGDAIDRMGRAARRRWLGAMMRGAQSSLSRQISRARQTLGKRPNSMNWKMAPNREVAESRS